MDHLKFSLTIAFISIMYTFKLTMSWKLDNRNLLYTNRDVIYECPLYTMCRCASLPNVTSLLEINCNEVALYKFPEFLHGTLKHIEISRTYIHSVEDETFQGLRLESLKLVDNKLQEFAEKSFSFMTHSMMSLDISGNMFQSIPLESIKNIHSLSRLIAQRNHIQHLDGNWGNLVDTLRSLHLSGNSITEISALHEDRKQFNLSSSSYQPLPLPSSIGGTSTIHHNQQQSHHQLQHQQQQMLQQQQQQQQQQFVQQHQFVKTFSKLRKLVWLDLSLNRITHLNLNSFPKSLVTIDLSKNLLQLFPIDVFEHLRELKILTLKDNLIVELSGIELMNSNSNQLSEISSYSSSSDGNSENSRIVHLEKLDVSLNLIEDFTTNLFSSMLTIKAINFDKNYIRYVPEFLFKNLGCAHMVLAFNLIEDIHPDAFDTLENSLEYLDLERNQLSHIPNAIGKLNKLRYLYFTSNNITSIDSLPATLKVLSLSGNHFVRIPRQALSNCTELSYLNMGYNRLSELQENDFGEWGSNLQTLLLRNNKITSLNYGVFNGLDSIREISLSLNDIHYVHPNVFENISKTLKILELSFGIYREDFPLDALSYLSELMWLGLDNNNLKVIPPESLSTMTQLGYINLAFNRIVQLPRNLFISDVHKTLVEVDLSYNVIEQLSSNSFEDLEIIQIINLSSNKLHTIHKYAFYNLIYLTYVDLTLNHLTNMSENAFAFLPNLQQLDFMYNNLKNFSLKSFKHCTNATTPMKLNISNNFIQHFDGELNSYLFIYSLDASHNFLSNAMAFKNIGYSLRVLYLNYNNFTNLANHAFGDLEMLEILNLAWNNLTLLRRRSFQGLSNLQELDLGHNQLAILQVEQFSNLKKLRVLKLNDNKLRALPRDVFLNTRLEFLDLSHNFITVWPSHILSDVGFTLRSIQLGGNNLEYLDSTMFLNTQFVLELSLANNQIKILPDNTFSSLNNLTRLDLSSNPLITTNFKELLLNVPNLRFLNLKSTGLYTLPILILNKLTELDVSKNYIQEIESLVHLSWLRVVRMSENRITNFTKIAKQLPTSVRVLDIGKNPIRKLTMHDFTQIRRLEELSIEDIKLPNNDTFQRLHCLKVLRINSQNNFGELVSRLHGLQQLHVNVYESTINDQMFAKMYANNNKIQLVEIIGNKLQMISSNAFYGLSRNHNLKVQIRNTLINDIPPGMFYALKYVSKLTIDISDNLIATLSPDSFYPNASSWDALGTRSIIGGIDIAGNPLQCDCGVVWFGHWLRRWLRETAQMNIMSKDELKQMVTQARRNTCKDPTTGKTLTFLEIFPEDLLCHASALSSFSIKLNFKLTFSNISTILFVIGFYKYFYTITQASIM